jgi:hypothetical protein
VQDWHQKNDWTGYTFDGNIFPYPADIMAWLHAKGLIILANLHDADGVGNFEVQFAAMATALGMNPNTTTNIPFNLVNSTHAYALEDIVLQPLEQAGMGA